MIGRKLQISIALMLALIWALGLAYGHLNGDTKFTPGGTQTTLSAGESGLARGGG